MSQPVIIFGAGGFAREVLQVILDINEDSQTWDPVGFWIEPGFSAPEEIHGLPVFTETDWIRQKTDLQVAIAVGSSKERSQIATRLRSASFVNFATLVHPRAWIGTGVDIGAGSVVCAGALLTTDIKVGEHVHINIGCTVGHDAELLDFVTLNPAVNVSGNVTVGEGSEVGTGSVLIPNVNVGDWSIVGAGSVVIQSLESNVTAVGAPARVVKKRPSNWQKEEECEL